MDIALAGYLYSRVKSVSFVIPSEFGSLLTPASLECNFPRKDLLAIPRQIEKKSAPPPKMVLRNIKHGVLKLTSAILIVDAGADIP